MPRVINGYGQTEFVVTPNTTHVLVENIRDSRRIFTDGRDWPARIEPSLLGYSIGKWIDADGDGKYDVLEVETRGFKGPRAYDASGIPLHNDNQSVIKERIYLDKNDLNTLRFEITVFDNALTRPWSVVKSYRRQSNPNPVWTEEVCGEGNNHVHIGKENYMVKRRRLPDAHQEGAAAAGSEVFPTIGTLTEAPHAAAGASPTLRRSCASARSTRCRKRLSIA
jgi:hypothetical protein